MALKRKGHKVEFFTSHHSPSHCFPETIDGSLNVTVIGDWLPRSIFGGFTAVCAYFRMIYIAICLLVRKDFYSVGDCDVIICDQVSAHIPLLKWITNKSTGKRAKILFYCHFPDQLLSQRNSTLKKVYRYPIDSYEEYTTGKADMILVNSHFTAGVFRDTFTSLSHINLKVLYPICNFDTFDRPLDKVSISFNLPQDSTIFLSINRYERKKNLDLCIKAFFLVKKFINQEWQSLPKCHLIVAGGYDERVRENIEYHDELVQLAEDYNVSKHVTFLKSPSDQEKKLLIQNSTALIYTPVNEHFGIVPLEAMYMRTPVIATNSGGPLETVIDCETGFLSDPDPQMFAEKMIKFVEDQSLSEKMGEKGRKHVINNFSMKKFDQELELILNQLSLV